VLFVPAADVFLFLKVNGRFFKSARHLAAGHFKVNWQLSSNDEAEAVVCARIRGS
jgi:hypothetical protein